GARLDVRAPALVSRHRTDGDPRLPGLRHRSARPGCGGDPGRRVRAGVLRRTVPGCGRGCGPGDVRPARCSVSLVGAVPAVPGLPVPEMGARDPCGPAKV